MKKTERLYGVQPEKYAKLQIELCEMKLADIEILRNKMRPTIDCLDFSDEQKDIQARLQEVQDAKKFNEDLIEEATGKV